MAAPFGPSSGAASSGPKVLVEFRAGKMRFNEANKLVTPDERKGVLSVLIADDQLVHLQWRDRTSGSIEDDFIICPNNFELKTVPACTTGRVFRLEFKNYYHRMFFWMQEPKTDNDKEYLLQVNAILNNPPAPGFSSSRPAASGCGLAQGFDNLGDGQLKSLLYDMSCEQLLDLFCGRLGEGNMAYLASLLGGASPSGRTRQTAEKDRLAAPSLLPTASLNLAAAKKKLATEMLNTAEFLDSLGEVGLPATPLLPPLSPPEVPTSTSLAPFLTPLPPSSHAALLSSIHQYRDQAVAALLREAAALTQDCGQEVPPLEQPRDFDAFADIIMSSFDAIFDCMAELKKCVQTLEAKAEAEELLGQIDLLKEGALLEKGFELRSFLSCSLQFREPVRNQNSQDLLEISVTAVKAKNFVYKVKSALMKVVVSEHRVMPMVLRTPVFGPAIPYHL